MNKEKYINIVKKHIKKPPFIKNLLIAFISGGLIGSICETLYKILINVSSISKEGASLLITLSIIIVTSFLTSIGIFDNFIAKCRSGLIIPTTGFAHSVSSSLIDSKKEGLITGIGSSMFNLAGSVILYSTIAAFILVLIKVYIIA